MPQPVHFVALLGSLRAQSYNRKALRAAQLIAPPHMTIELLEGLGDLPAYNSDIQEKHGLPAVVNTLAQRIQSADGLLIVSPEYNYGVPGFLKNAIDWISRHPSKPFSGKATGIMGASTGVLGTARMQYQLRQMLVALNSFPVNTPEVMIMNAREKFSETGELTDEKTKEFIGRLLAAVEDLSGKLTR